MIEFFDNLFPWFGDMVELGGSVLVLIVILAMFLWALILERVLFLLAFFPSYAQQLSRAWQARSEHRSWLAQQFRARLLLHSRWNLERNLSLIRTLIMICPLLGLLGTVLGMLEVFDAMAATGNNNPRSTAAGVSKATITTLAGMVVAISAMLVYAFLERRIQRDQNQLAQQLPFGEPPGK